MGESKSSQSTKNMSELIIYQRNMDKSEIFRIYPCFFDKLSFSTCFWYFGFVHVSLINYQFRHVFGTFHLSCFGLSNVLNVLILKEVGLLDG